MNSISNAPAAQPNHLLLSQDIRMTDADRANGTITVGGVAMNPSDALAFANIARAGVINEVGFDRLNEAQKFVDNMRQAREILQTVTQQKDLIKGGGVDYGPGDQITFTKAQAEFLTNVVEESIPVETVNFTVGATELDHVPQALVQASGLQFDQDGNFLYPEKWHVPSLSTGQNSPGWDDPKQIDGSDKNGDGHRYSWNDAWPQWGPSHPDWSSAEFGAQSPARANGTDLGEHNHTRGIPLWGRGETETGALVTRDSGGYTKVWMEGGKIHKDSAERLEENLKHFIEQMGNDNSLHMSKTKNVLSQANNAIEAANSIINANKDKIEKVISSTR